MLDKEKVKTIEVITLEDLMKTDERITWRIGGFLPKGCIAVLSGISGVKRSFFLQQMSLALATGQDFLCYPVVSKSKVLMYEAELTKGELKERGAHMLKLYPVTPNLLFNKGYTLKLDKDCKSLTDTMNALTLDVAVLDPLYMLHSGDIKEEQDMMGFLNPLESYCLETGKNIIIAAHSTKVWAGTPQNRSASGGAVKGTTAQVQVAAYVWTLSDSFTSSNEGQLIFGKTRDMPRPGNLDLEFRTDTCTFQLKKIPDAYKIDWLKKQNAAEKSKAAELLMTQFGIGRSKAYELATAVDTKVAA